MWLFTRIGFFSVVQDRGDKDRLVVRARLLKDARGMAAFLRKAGRKCKVKTTPKADFRYRLNVTRDDFRDAVVGLIAGLEYGNFRAALHDGTARDFAYLAVWQTMHRLQTEPAGCRGRGRLPPPGAP